MKSNGARGRTPVGAIEDAIWEDAFLSLHEKAVLLALKHHTSDLDNGCWPSEATCPAHKHVRANGAQGHQGGAALWLVEGRPPARPGGTLPTQCVLSRAAQMASTSGTECRW